MSQIQNYVHIYDLKPTEPLFDIVNDKRSPNDEQTWTIEELEADIRKNGILLMIQIDSEGNILNGNGRYHIAMKLFLEGDMRFEYIAVELARMSGKFVINFEDEPTAKLAAEVFSKVLMVHYEVIPSETKFQEYPIDKINPRQLDRHKYVTDYSWETFKLKTPKGWAVLYQKKVREPPKISFEPEMLGKLMEEKAVD